jgi:hypothetical protein
VSNRLPGTGSDNELIYMRCADLIGRGQKREAIRRLSSGLALSTYQAAAVAARIEQLLETDQEIAADFLDGEVSRLRQTRRIVPVWLKWVFSAVALCGCLLIVLEIAEHMAELSHHAAGLLILIGVSCIVGIIFLAIRIRN